MSYLAGLTLGTLVAEKFLKPKAGNEFYLVHATPTRRRYLNPQLMEENFAQQVFNTLKQLDQIKSISINPVTASLVICFQGSAENIDQLINRLNHAPAPPLNETSLVQTKLARAFRRADRCIAETTRGYFDLSTALGAVFLIWGVNKVIKLKQQPAGPQMLWWSYKLLKGK
ncbi:MAG: HMA2 domain-containing protein [Bacillota bacterium]|nr:hypothetical protein [Bacillota bacterium]